MARTPRQAAATVFLAALLSVACDEQPALLEPMCMRQFDNLCWCFAQGFPHPFVGTRTNTCTRRSVSGLTGTTICCAHPNYPRSDDCNCTSNSACGDTYLPVDACATPTMFGTSAP